MAGIYEACSDEPAAVRRRAAKVATGICLAATGAVVVAGCASKGAATAPVNAGSGSALTAVAAHMYSAKSFHVHGTSGVAGSPGQTTFDGVVQMDPAFALDVKISGSPAPSPTPGGALDPIGPMGSAPTEVVITKAVMYMKTSSLGGVAKPGVTWLSMPLSGPGADGGGSDPLTEIAEDPRALLTRMLAAGAFTSAGTATVDGVPATHYTGTLTDPSLLSAPTPAPAPSPSRSATAPAAPAPTTPPSGDTAPPVTADVWIAADGLPVELKAHEAGSTSTTDLHFSAWGAPVTITAPPAAQVESIDQLAGGPTLPDGTAFPTDLPTGFMPTEMPTDVFPSGMPTTCVPPSVLMGPGTLPSGMPTDKICVPVAALPPTR